MVQPATGRPPGSLVARAPDVMTTRLDLWDAVYGVGPSARSLIQG